MRIDSKGLIVAMVISFLLATTSLVFSTQTYTGMAMNASLSQPIDITISANYTAGIFFTNSTFSGTGVQYPLTSMEVDNNATGNYAANSSTVINGTDFYVTSSASNTINVTVHHCACGDLICQAGGDCTQDVDFLYINATLGDGVGWVNGTAMESGLAHAPTTYFIVEKAHQNIGLLDAGNSIYLRYWLDPSPDSSPSGTYQTTYEIRAVQHIELPGSCTCA